MADRLTNSSDSLGPKSRKRSRQRSSEEAATTASDAVNPPTQGRKDEASSLLQDAGDHQSCSRQPKCRRLAPFREEHNINVLPASSLGSLLQAPLSSASSYPSSSSSCPSSSSSCLAPIAEEDDDFVVTCTSARQQSLPFKRKRGLKRRMTSVRTSTAADAVNPPTQGRKDEASSLLQDAGNLQSCSRQPKCRRLAPFREEQNFSILPAASSGSLLDSPLSSASCSSSSSSCPSSSSSCLAPIAEEDDDFVVTCTSARQQSLPFKRKRGLKRRMMSVRTSTAADAVNPPTQGRKDEASSLLQDAGNRQSCSRQPKCRRLAPSREERNITVLPASSLGSLLEAPLSSASSCQSSSSSCTSSSSSCPSSSFSCPSSSSSPFPSFSRPSPSSSSTSIEGPEMIVISSDDEDDDELENSPIQEQLNMQQASFDLSPRSLPPIDIQNETPEPPDLRDLHDLREPEVWLLPPIESRMFTVETCHFPTKIFTSAAHNHQTKCCICTDEYIVGETLRVLPCFHAYHVKCIDTWLKVKKICPLCRMQLC